MNAAEAVKEATNSTEAKAAAAKERAAAKAVKDAEKAAAVQARKDAAEAAKAAKANAPKRKCLCGCGGDVNGKSNFLPGHDARLVGKVARGEADASLLEGFPALQAKAERMKTNLGAKAAAATERAAAKTATDTEKAAAKVTKDAEKAAAKAAKDAEKAAAAAKATPVAGTQDADVEIKVGGEWLPGSKVSEAGGKVVVRHKNAKNEWVTTNAPAKNVRAIQDL